MAPFKDVTTENVEKTTSRSDIVLLKEHNLNFVPIETTGDGNCLFHAVSISLYGNESETAQLKKIVAYYFAENFELLKQKYPQFEGLFQSDQETFESCAIMGKWANTLTILAIVNALRINFNSVYPPINGHDEFVHTTLNTTIIPFEGQTDKTVNILWSGWHLVDFGKSKVYQPNHFVALLVPEEANDLPIIESGKF